MAAQAGAAISLISAISSVVKNISSAFSKSSATTTSATTTSSSSSSSSSTSSSASTVFTALGNLIKLLPAGTVFLFQYLSPITTNNGSCSSSNKALTAILIAVCGILCFISSFTDSYTSSDGSTHYGIATFSGLVTITSSSSSSSSSSSTTSLSSYRLRFTDFVHAFMKLIIFAVLSLLDTNTVNCFYPSFLTTEKTIISVLPIVVGSISSTVSVLFPSDRNGVGSSTSSSSSSSSTSTSSADTTSTA
ncbi:hypothetical protein SAY87_009537 [Trapa incisa]|uniref:Uncharacterized protein n=1 Tax=Trapa incisa TaxID=236973 RepID=A0AAN7Q2U4_9MYRT|nr:hypothetical protein SAY87_009537 [Trapa incisa]